jgi:lysozyme family protein
MANFPPAFNFMMDHEDPRREGKVTKDSGGLTRWGISQKAYPHINIPALALAAAAVLYERDYFAPIQGYRIGDQRIASKLFDMAVNMGVKRAIMLLQSALNTHVQPRTLLLKEDGVIGPQTLISANHADTFLLLTGLVELSREHYREIARARPDEACDLKGWLARAEKLPPECTGVSNAAIA